MAATASANDLFIMMLKLYTLCSHAQSFSHYRSHISLPGLLLSPEDPWGRGTWGSHMNDHSFFGQPCQKLRDDLITWRPLVRSRL